MAAAGRGAHLRGDRAHRAGCVERYGVDSIRLTGGEPTVRAHIVGLVERLAALRTADGRSTWR